MNFRSKVGDADLSASGPSTQRTVLIAGEPHAFNDSKAPTIFADVVTEVGAANGMVCIGLGHLVFPPEGRAEVEGDVHLRLSVPMAAGLIETLSDALRRASEQRSKTGKRNTN